MIELILLIIVAFGLFKILRGVWYFMRGVFVLLFASFNILFRLNKSYDKMEMDKWWESVKRSNFP
jgi:hypothetical protein